MTGRLRRSCGLQGLRFAFAHSVNLALESATSAGQAMQQAKAGMEAVHLPGWQIAIGKSPLTATLATVPTTSHAVFEFE